MLLTDGNSNRAFLCADPRCELESACRVNQKTEETGDVKKYSGERNRSMFWFYNELVQMGRHLNTIYTWIWWSRWSIVLRLCVGRQPLLLCYTTIRRMKAEKPDPGVKWVPLEWCWASWSEICHEEWWAWSILPAQTFCEGEHHPLVTIWNRFLCFAQVRLTSVLDPGQRRGISLGFKVLDLILGRVWMKKEIKLMPQQTGLPWNDNFFFFFLNHYLNWSQSQILLFEITGVREGRIGSGWPCQNLRHEASLDSA